MYIYCVVCYRVIVAPYVRSVGHVFAYLYILWTMILLYSLKFFLYDIYIGHKYYTRYYISLFPYIFFDIVSFWRFSSSLFTLIPLGSLNI